MLEVSNPGPAGRRKTEEKLRLEEDGLFGDAEDEVIED